MGQYRVTTTGGTYLVTTEDKPSFAQRAGQFAIKEGIPTAGMVAGEVGGGALGALGAPFTGGASIPAGEVAGGGVGYGLGKGVAQQIQESMGTAPPTTFGQKLKQFPGNVAMGSAFSLGGKALKPVFGAVKKGLPMMAKAFTGIDEQEFAQHAKDLKATLPRLFGGSKTVEAASADYRAMLARKGINPESLEFDELSSTSGQKKLFIREVAKDVKTPVPGGKVSTPDLIKAYEGVSDEIGKAYSAEDPRAARQLIRRYKEPIRKELFGRGDDIAQSYKDIARAKMAKNVSKLMPAGRGSGYLLRRAAIPAIAYMNPKFLIGMSPRIWSAAQMAASAVPNAVYGQGAVEALRSLRNLRKSEDSNP